KADELPSSLAKTLLHQWRQGPLTEEETLAVLLEAALLLEKDETMRFVKEELQLIQVAEALKE
ncbi:hypothetical protein GWN63_03535, partial [Candidatus Bathyarchaeota archaeon]|nr:hypothetical protein [Candidatus Bathyarchaeota archaeon]NIV68180.1 hypothetical protein [Candidatus Bathyarchaeota archaeon]NIW16292.1 hypothetical protein [Candidatus Bathyarchaeota archaeon]NIW34412.1 hypothetical protein [Candidatus Bathyarchaeota archaeon]